MYIVFLRERVIPLQKGRDANIPYWCKSQIFGHAHLDALIFAVKSIF